MCLRIGFTAFSASGFATQHLLLWFRISLDLSGVWVCLPTSSFMVSDMVLGFATEHLLLGCRLWLDRSGCTACHPTSSFRV